MRINRRALLTLLAALVTSGVAASSASAWTPLGPSWQLHVEAPFFLGSGASAEGWVTGPSNNVYYIAGQVCLQVLGPDGVTWYTKTGGCSGWDATDPVKAPFVSAVVGHVYRSWDKFQVNGYTATYTSSPTKFTALGGSYSTPGNYTCACIRG